MALQRSKDVEINKQKYMPCHEYDGSRNCEPRRRKCGLTNYEAMLYTKVLVVLHRSFLTAEWKCDAEALKDTRSMLELRMRSQIRRKESLEEGYPWPMLFELEVAQ